MASIQVGPEAVHDDICLMLDQLHQLESCSADDGAQTASLIDNVNSALRKLPPNSLLHSRWQKTQSQYEEIVSLISIRRAALVEARTRLDPNAKNSCRRTETPSGRSSNISDQLSTRKQSYAGNHSPPVCHVKPTQLLNEATTSSSTAPFDVRNYLIDKNAPITEPVFKPQMSSVVEDSARRRSFDVAAPVDLHHRLPVCGSSPVNSASKPAATSLPPVCSRWKVLRKKAVGLFLDGFGRSPSQPEHSSPHQLNTRQTSTKSLQRLEYH